MARMYGAFGKPRCPSCRAASGSDCADASRGKRAQRFREEREWRRDWADDMDDAYRERWDVETLSLTIRRRHDDPVAYLEKYYGTGPLWEFRDASRMPRMSA